MNYGKITVGVGTPEKRDIEIQNFILVTLKDNRLISISSLEDGSMVAAVDNPPSSGRSPQSTIWLSKESFVGLLAVAGMYFEITREDLGALIFGAMTDDVVHYSCSANLRDDNLTAKIDEL